MKSAAPAVPAPDPTRYEAVYESRGDMNVGVRTEHEAGVVRDVEPFVPVAAPRVGKLHTVHEVLLVRTGGCPQPERAVQVNPAAKGMDEFARVDQIVASARVHVPGLEAHDRRAGRTRLQHAGQVFDVDRSLGIGRDVFHAAVAEAEQAKRTVDGGVSFSAGDDTHGRRAAQTVALDIPTGLGQLVMAGSGDAHGVRLLGSGDEADRRRPGDAE